MPTPEKPPVPAPPIEIIPIPVDIAAVELDLIERELRRRRYRTDPVSWAQERLGAVLWSKQREIMHAVKDHRRVAIKSCHQIGKSYIAATIVGWWLDNLPVGDAFVVTSAPSGPQVKAILWREIGRVHGRGKLPGRVNQTEWYMVPKTGNSTAKEELVAFGRKPSDMDMTAFQGIHARHVLVLFDESCGMPPALWEAADSLIANDYSKAIAIGNPDDPNTQFAELFKPGSGWCTLEIGAFDTPNFTGEELPEYIRDQLIGRTYVEEKRRKWAPQWSWTPDGKKVVPPEGVDPSQTNPLWQSKILGKFPPISEEQALFPLAWVKAAAERSLEPVGPNELGVDVGGGGDSSTGAHRRGPVVRIAWEDHNPDTMQTCGNVIHWLHRTKASVAKIDMIGIGRGVVDRAKELGEPVVGINVGEAAQEKKNDEEEGFVNYKAQLCWFVRGLFERGEIDIDPLDEDLQAELVSIRYKRTSNNKIQIESKHDAMRRGIPSPNRADALILCFAEAKPVLRRATWGR